MHLVHYVRTHPRRAPAFLLLAGLILALGAATQTPAATPQDQSAAPAALAKGVVIPEVPENADPSQTFALYLPADYTTKKQWPVIYAFDWAARGKVPAELYAPAAQKRGYIVIASNNSRNGSAKESLDAALALWNDTRFRFSIDPQQVYATGFSGASRSAFVFADQCMCVRGVIAVGAGLPPLKGQLLSLPFVVFMTLGYNDFNYPELVELQQTLDSLHLPNRLRRFDGDHQWPPPEIAAEAVDWMQLEAIRQNRRPKDEAFIEDMRAAALARAKAAEKAGDLLSAYDEYRKSAADLDGLADTAAFSARAAEMKASPDLQKAQKQEREDIAKQRRLMTDIETQLTALPTGSMELGKRLSDITSMANELNERADRAKDPRDVRVFHRAIFDAFATAYEAGLGKARQGDTQMAEMYFQVAGSIAPKLPGPPFELAKLYARAGDKKRALRSLETAVAKGVKNPASLRNPPEFESLRGEEKYQQLVAQLERGQQQQQ